MVKISKLFLIYFGVVFFGFIDELFSSKNDAPIKLKNLICEANDSWVTNLTCKVKAHSRTKRTAEILGYIIQPIEQFSISINVFKRYSGWKPWVISNFTTNGCDFVAGKNHHVILKFVRKLILENTSFNHSCPYLPGPAVVTDFDLSKMSLGTLIIPNGEYRVDLELRRSPKIRIVLVTFVAEVWEKR